MLPIKELMDKILFDFDSAIIQLEALNNYFVETRDLINSEKANLKNKFELACSLAKKLDEIYSIPLKDRKKYVKKIQEESIKDNIKIKDIVKILIVKDKDSILYKLKSGYKGEKYNPSIARRKSRALDNQENIFVRAILSNIIIIFEQYLSKYYETLVLSDPKKYFENKQVEICEIFNGDICQLLERLITQEVEKNMFDSLNILDKIKDKDKIDVDRLIPIRNEFEEVYYRRNVYVHANGNANKIYLDKVNSKFTQKINEGDKLICDDIYLENAILTVSKIIASLHFELLHISNAASEKYNSLADVGFEEMKKERYILSEYIYGILRRESNFEYKDKAIYEVNYINSLKMQGKNKEAKELINKFDVSIATDDFKIAKECLLDNHEQVYKLLTKTYPESFNALMIREWPIFICFRGSEYYPRFIEEHKEDFQLYEFEKEDLEEI